MCVCVFARAFARTCVFILSGILTSVVINIHAYTHARKCTHLQANARAHAHTHTHTHASTLTHKSTHTHTHAHTDTHTNTHTHAYTHTHTHTPFMHTQERVLHLAPVRTIKRLRLVKRPSPHGYGFDVRKHPGGEDGQDQVFSVAKLRTLPG